nr:hypothetical protein CFP56_21173 [Quercus suber]
MDLSHAAGMCHVGRETTEPESGAGCTTIAQARAAEMQDVRRDGQRSAFWTYRVREIRRTSRSIWVGLGSSA